MKSKEIDYIARRYRKGYFSPDSGWRRLRIAPVPHWKRYRVAAAVAATIVLSATAALIYQEYKTVNVPQQTVETTVASSLAEVRVIDFENASLIDVVRKIEEVYGVKVENLPEQGDEYELSLHYEGTPTDLISVINDILGTQMTVAEK